MKQGLLVGLDIGGTKTQLRIARADGSRVRDSVFPTTTWRAEPHAEKALAVRSWVERAIDLGSVAALAVGAHGCDSQDECDMLRGELHELLRVPTVVVNDAQLLGPAAGADASIQLIAGTGSIAAGRKSTGESLFAGGWGWLVGDEGGAAGLVRDAVTRLTHHMDQHGSTDALETRLLSASGVADLRSLTMRMMKHGGEEFPQWAPAVFAAADDGSALAAEAIQFGAEQLVRLVGVLLSAGAVADRVVAAGSVVVHQPMLAESLRRTLLRQFDLALTVLATDPVEGAIRLALRELELTRRPTPEDRAPAPL